MPQLFSYSLQGSRWGGGRKGNLKILIFCPELQRFHRKYGRKWHFGGTKSLLNPIPALTHSYSVSLCCTGEDAGSAGGVKVLVMKQSSSFQEMQPKRLYIDQPLPTHTHLQAESDDREIDRGTELPVRQHLQGHGNQTVDGKKSGKWKKSPTFPKTIPEHGSKSAPPPRRSQQGSVLVQVPTATTEGSALQ